MNDDLGTKVSKSVKLLHKDDNHELLKGGK